jgi:hypothetical protein
MQQQTMITIIIPHPTPIAIQTYIMLFAESEDEFEMLPGTWMGRNLPTKPNF